MPTRADASWVVECPSNASSTRDLLMLKKGSCHKSVRHNHLTTAELDRRSQQAGIGAVRKTRTRSPVYERVCPRGSSFKSTWGSRDIACRTCMKGEKHRRVNCEMIGQAGAPGLRALHVFDDRVFPTTWLPDEHVVDPEAGSAIRQARRRESAPRATRQSTLLPRVDQLKRWW